MRLHELPFSRICLYSYGIISAQILLSNGQVIKRYENFKNSSTKNVDQNEIKMYVFIINRDFWWKILFIYLIWMCPTSNNGNVK